MNRTGTIASESGWAKAATAGRLRIHCKVGLHGRTILKQSASAPAWDRVGWATHRKLKQVCRLHFRPGILPITQEQFVPDFKGQDGIKNAKICARISLVCRDVAQPVLG